MIRYKHPNVANIINNLNYNIYKKISIIFTLCFNINGISSIYKIELYNFIDKIAKIIITSIKDAKITVRIVALFK